MNRALRLGRMVPVGRAWLARGLADEAAGMLLTFASPTTMFYDRLDVKQVDVPTFSGSFGILPRHVPTLAVLQPGVVTIIEQDDTKKRVFVSSGTVTVNEDSSVQILAQEACRPEQLDAAAARDELQDAQSAETAAVDELERAEAKIRVTVAEAAVRAAGEGH